MSVAVHHGDCSEVIRALADCSLDSCVTDPPYALVSIVKRFGKPGSAECKHGKDGAYKRASRGFMGKQWDTGDVAFAPEFWAEVLRVLKPGAHLLAFSGTRTYHRLACAIEAAGFEIRDQIGWLYGSGFPKSHNVGKKLPEWEGWGTALKPAWEPIVLARKPLSGTVASNVSAHGTGALHIEACRIEGEAKPFGRGTEGTGGYRLHHRDVSEWKPADSGRWPANVIHDGSDEVVAAFPETSGQSGAVTGDEPSSKTNNTYGQFNGRPATQPRGDAGSAARFFYSSKADAADRLESKHPTVKPVDLMAYLCRLVTPPGGTVLDPFAGSGTTGMACMREGFHAVLIEREAEYVADIHRRLAHVQGSDTPLFAEPPPQRDLLAAIAEAS
jgi:site-specific DNA-methyltransferase (adenine-specific)